MSQAESIRGHAVVMQPKDGVSYWQPVPANGHADPKLYPANTRYDGLSMGFQTVTPGSHIREHSHGGQIELQVCFRGTGRVVVDGVGHDVVPGTACFLGHDVKHEIYNNSADDLVIRNHALPCADGGELGEILPLLEKLHGREIAPVAHARRRRHGVGEEVHRHRHVDTAQGH